MYPENKTAITYINNVLEISVSKKYSDFHLSNSFLRIDSGSEIISFDKKTKLDDDILKLILALLYLSQKKETIEAKLDTKIQEPINLKEISKLIYNKVKKEKTLDFGVDTDYSTFKLVKARIRIQVYLSEEGLKITGRLLRNKIPELNELGFKHEHIDMLTDLVGKRSGLVLFTGATGTGKTTTLASLMQWTLHNKKKHIVTLEDPIEYKYENSKGTKPTSSFVTQQEVGIHVNSYKQGLKDSLRKHPHIILLGEIRDAETMEICLEAVQTGHLVISTLHTRSAAETLNRIKELFPKDAYERILGLLADTLKLVVCQTLLPSKIKNKKELAYELLEINDVETKSAVRKFGKSQNQLKDVLAKMRNQSWKNCLANLVETDKIDDKILKEFELNDNL